MLKFIGTGSAFNTKLGNNSAYLKQGNQMLLIDCGSNVFQRIKENNLLEGIDKIHVLITHTHADHVGSLADLILYSYYSHGEFAKAKVEVYSVKDIEVNKLLEINGCVEGEHYTVAEVEHDLWNVNVEEMDLNFYFFEQQHVEELKCYGIEMASKDFWLHYSSDAKELGDTATFINEYDSNRENNVYYYIDTCAADYEGNVHLSLRELTELIPPDKRDKVWCMHLDEKFDAEYAKSLGFNVAESEFNKRIT